MISPGRKRAGRKLYSKSWGRKEEKPKGERSPGVKKKKKSLNGEIIPRSTRASLAQQYLPV
jgi:hypothetical protein